MEKSIWFSFPFVCPYQSLPLFLFLPPFVRTVLCDVSLLFALSAGNVLVLILIISIAALVLVICLST